MLGDMQKQVSELIGIKFAVWGFYFLHKSLYQTIDFMQKTPRKTFERLL